MKIQIYLFLSLFSNIILSQKYDYVWTLGTGTTAPDSIHGGTDIDFNFNPPEVRYINRSTKFYFVTSSMSNYEGVLQYYSNGCYVWNANQEILQNGKGLNPGNVYNNWCTGNNGFWVVLQSIINLPFQTNPSKYGMFHLGEVDVGLINDRIIPCYYSEIDMSANNGIGALVKKNVPIINDTLGAFIKAVKHADGKSWWIIASGRSNRNYYRMRFYDGVIEGPLLQVVEDTCKNPNNTGQSAFSANGSMYAHFDPWTGLIIYNFDRATGLLYKKEKIEFWYDPDSDIFRGGLSFSPNGKLLYVCTSKELYQFDLEELNIRNSRILIDTIDGFHSPFLVTFLNQELAPNGKIYISSGNSVNYWGVINQPDERGLACDFKQHSFKLASLNFWCIPNFPNYRLGPLVSTEENEKLQLSLNPNPSKNYFSVDGLTRNATIRLYDQNGDKVIEQKISPYYNMIYIDQLLNGLYFVSIDCGNKMIWEKLLKL